MLRYFRRYSPRRYVSQHIFRYAILLKYFSHAAAATAHAAIRLPLPYVTPIYAAITALLLMLTMLRHFAAILLMLFRHYADTAPPLTAPLSAIKEFADIDAAIC